MNGKEDLLVAGFALILLPMIALRILRGYRDGRLPIYRTTLTRADHMVKFNLVLFFHIVSFLIVGFIAADLLLRLNLKGGS